MICSWRLDGTVGAVGLTEPPLMACLEESMPPGGMPMRGLG